MSRLQIILINIFQEYLDMNTMKNSTAQYYASNCRKVFDSVYGFISFPKQIWEFIDTPHFQRLRNIKQLGCLSWVFPGAVGTRFQHSLGTGYLAQKYITILIQKHKTQNYNPDVYKDYYSQDPKTKKFRSTIYQAIFTVTLAGILHDVGHGPYSHLFDSKVVEQVDKRKWEHQIASLCLIDAMYETVLKLKTDEKEAQWLKGTKNRVKSLIIGKITEAHYQKQKDGSYIRKGSKQVDNLQKGFNEVFKDQLKTRPWEFQLISNRLTGIDVDKLDYFRRDAYYLGAKNIYIDHQLLMNQTLILKQQQVGKFQEDDQKQSKKHRLCYPTKYSDKVYDIYYSRYRLYKTYYMSLKANGVDFMLAQVLLLAQPYLELKQICKQLLNGNCKRYIRLTDSILDKIQDVYNNTKDRIDKGQQINDEKLQKILKAGQILENLKNRQIYDFIKEYHQSYSFQNICHYYKIKKQWKEMTDLQNQKNDEIILHCTQIGFGIKDKDPFQQCRFYDKSVDPKKIQQSNQRNFSMLRPEGIIQISLRLYLKNRSKNPNDSYKNKIKQLQKNISAKIKKIGFIEGQSGTYTNRSQPRQKQNVQQKNAQKQLEKLKLEQDGL